MDQARLAAWLEQELGEVLRAMAPVGGGCIHSAWRLELADGRRLFAKTNRASLLPVLAAEADGLRALAEAVRAAAHTDGRQPLTIPTPLTLAERDGTALLLLSWLELGVRCADPDGAWRCLGTSLAQLHRASLSGHDGRFGWGQDNFIGSGPQPNGWCSDWGRFFSEQRLGAQLAWAARGGRRLAGGEALLERAAAWLGRHGAEPCLVHGDLWSGNAALLADGGGALFDPAVYRGDREVDLAMAQLFGGFPPAFFAGYEAAWPLPPGHERRREIYNLYHRLNHANLFGGSYWPQAERSIAGLLRGNG
jgi:fructosamine-3-kinase